MSVLVFLIALSGIRYEAHDHFDMLEVNHFHNRYGSTVFVQLIYWDWHREDGRFRAQGWKIMKDAFDKNDAEHRRRYEAELDLWLSRVSDVVQRSRIRNQMDYKGKFVGGRLYPTKQHRTGKYQVQYYDDAGVMRVITADLFRETHTNHDPEMEDRKHLPEAKRRGLTVPGGSDE